MPPSVHLLREKPPLVLSSWGGLCSEILYLFSSFATWKSWGPPSLAPQTHSTSTHSVQKHTHCPSTLAALFTASHWCLYQSSFLVPLVLVPVPLYARIFLPTQVPEALGALMLVARSCSALF